MTPSSRREFLRQSIHFGAAAAAAGPLARVIAQAADLPAATMRLGLVTYQWAKDWDLPTLLANCQQAKILGVELRTGHKHGVEPSLDAAGRAEVKKRFADSPVICVGPGSAECFDDPDPAKLQKAIEATKAFVKLSHDIGASGVKVRPNSFHSGVAHEKTIEQIGKSLNLVGKFAGDYGQRIRLEIHGGCAPLPIMKQVADFIEDPHVGLCWNSNAEDLRGEGFEYNFNLVKDRLGDTAHVRKLSAGDYPYGQLFKLMRKAKYAGWVLLECGDEPGAGVPALVQQREVFEKLMAEARA